MNDENAARAVEGFDRGVELFGLTKGQFSLIDLLVALLGKTGPADVVISTWTAARKEISDAARLMREDRICSVLWLVDFSFPARQPRYCADLRQRFGDDCIRVTKCHAKFLLIRNDDWAVVVRTSMNLNRNTRLETFEISHDPALAKFLERVVAEVFDSQEPGEAFERRPGELAAAFEVLGREAKGPADDDAYGRCLDDPLGKRFEVLR